MRISALRTELQGWSNTFNIRIAPKISFIRATRSSLAFIRLSCAPTTILPAKWFNGKNRHVTASPTKADEPSKVYKKIVPTMISIGESLTQLRRRLQCGSSQNAPTSVKICQLNSLTLSTSVVISVMICALLEKSPLSSSLSELSEAESVMSLSLSLFSEGPEDEATSFLTSVLAKRIEFSCIRIPTCSVVVERDHIWPLTNAFMISFPIQKDRESTHSDGWTPSRRTCRMNKTNPSSGHVFRDPFRDI
jgi:hypothetical protein